MQYNEFRIRAKQFTSIGLVILLSAFLVSCASNRVAPQDVPVESSDADTGEAKLITDIRTENSPDSISVAIDGNRLLTYTSVKQPLPMGLVLYFPETSLSMGQTEFEAESDVIGSIKAAELIEDGPSKITIAMKVDAAYQITREGNGLKITFSKVSTSQDDGNEETSEAIETEGQTYEDAGSVAEDAMSQTGEVAAAEPAAELIPATIPASEPELPESVTGENILHAIKTDYRENGMDVTVQLDRAVQDYKTFTLKNPARIVVDLYGVKSDNKRQKMIPVDSQWVKQVRHFAHPDKVRVVLDVEDAYLTSYRADPSKEGLKVQIGEFEMAAESGEGQPGMETRSSTESVAAAPTPPVSVAAGGMGGDEGEPLETVSETVAPEVTRSAMAASGPALVNKIDFLSQEGGKSSIIIGTTRPVKYNLDGTDNKKLRLELFDTKIMSYRQRPLITTRFESAVDRIIPVQTEKMFDTSRIVIELREAVTYSVNQAGSQISIDFAASSIAPKPFEEANLPPWKTVMQEEAKVAEEKISATESAAPGGETVPVAAPAPEIAKTEAEPGQETENPIPDALPEVSGPEEPVDIAGIESSISDAFGEKEDVPLPEGAEDFATDSQEDQETTAESKRIISKPKKRYTGEKIALDFYQTDIKNVLRILRDVSGRNFAVDKDVSGTVTLTLVKPVPWDQVLDLILRMNGLGQISEGEIVRIVTVATIAKEEQRRADELKAKHSIQQQEKALEQLFTEYIPINYADAEADIKPRLQEIKTPGRGKIGVDKRNNQLIITDTAEKIEEAKILIRSIDKVTPQVIIEARVVEVSEDFSRTMGTEWNMQYGPVTQGDNSHIYDIGMNHAVQGSGSVGYTFARIGDTPITLDATLHAAEASGDGKIISTPKIVTLDNKAAKISQGIDYPYFEKDSTGGGTSVKFKAVNLSLDVTPHVTPDNRVSLKIKVAKNDVASFSSGVPAVTTNSADTELLVNDGDTVVIGGIIKTNRAEGYSKFPILNKVPFLGWLFKSKTVSKSKSELLIFITPKIVHLETNA